MRKPVIIERPGLLSIPQRMLGWFMTSVWWSFFFWLWVPLLVKLDDFAFLMPYTTPHIFTTEGFDILLRMILFCAIAAIVISLTAGGWAWYNLARFRHNRRKRPANLANQHLAEHFRVNPGRLAQWQKVKRLRVHHNEQGQLHRIETLGTGPLPRVSRPPRPVSVKQKTTQQNLTLH